MLSFFIPLAPRGQARAKAARMPNGRTVVYKSTPQREAEKDLCALLAPHRPAKPLEGPLCLSVWADMPIPGSWPKKKRAEAISGSILPTGKPDLDNIVKHLKDCMTQMGFWQDDKQVIHLEAAKLYGENPGWSITLKGYMESSI